jgi:hypothetical protein
MKIQFLKLLYKITNNFSENVAISKIISEITDVSVEERWGGEHIKYFPPYSFYRTYISGEKEKARKDMEQWYYNRFVKDKLYAVPKKRGGMLNGSIFKVVTEIHKLNRVKLKKDLSNSVPALVLQGIREKVKHRFKLVESIIENGYQDTENPVCLRKTGDYFVLIDGHHRVAAMAACGYSTLPHALIFF